MSPPFEILHLGAEGGGGHLFGEPGEQTVTYWFEGTQMSFDRDDNEIWIPWTVDRTDVLEKALPKHWRILYPADIHPDYVDQIRNLWLSPEDSEPSHSQKRWLELLGIPA